MELTPKQREHYNSLESTFNTAGWTLLSQTWTVERDILAERLFFGATTYEDLQQARVRYGLLSEMIDLPGETEKQKQLLLTAPEEDELV